MIGVSTSKSIATLKVAGRFMMSGTIGGRFVASGSFFDRTFDRSEMACFSAGMSSSGAVSNLLSALTMSSRAGAACAAVWPREAGVAKAQKAGQQQAKAGRAHQRYPASIVAWVQLRLTPLAVSRHGTDLLVSLVEPWHSLMISSRQDWRP